MKVGLVIIG